MRQFAIAFAGVITIVTLIVSCGGNSDNGSNTNSGAVAIALEFPDGFDVNRSTGEVYTKSGATQATAPSYVTSVTVTVTGINIDPIIHNVPLDTGIIEGSVPPGDYTFSAVVNTNIGLTFTGSSAVTLMSGVSISIPIKLSVNAPPVISSLTASKTSNVVNGDNVSLTAVATDADNDPITYTWSGVGGSISGTAETATFIAGIGPDYSVTLTVTDGKGGLDTMTLSLVAGIVTPPTGVTATAGNTQVTVSWIAVTGATSYNLYWSTTPGVTIATGTQIAGVTSPYVHTGLTNGTPYYYIVTSVNTAGESVESTEVSASPSCLGATVNSTADTNDVNNGDGICADAGGLCSLRAAIQETNLCAGAETVTIPAGTYTLAIAGAGEDASLTGDLDITDNLTISGAGAGATTIDGAGLDRVFHIITGATVTISNLKFIGGGGVTSGAGILNAGTLTVSNSTINGNTSTNLGGAFSNATGASLTITNSTINGNLASAWGGGIYSSGTLSISSSTISSNTASSMGGAMAVIAGSSTTVNNSTFSANTSVNSGAGIWNSGGTLNITDCTISGNNATNGQGAGIYQSTSAITNITSSTISGNIAGAGGGGGGGLFNSLSNMTIVNSTISGNSSSIAGGGIYSSGTTTVTNSTITGNSSGSGGGLALCCGAAFNMSNSIVTNQVSGLNCNGTLTSNLNNLDSDGSCGALITANPLLGGLANYGGLTTTHSLLIGSPAINAGNNGACPASDQRGVARSDGSCDIGAYEYP